MTKLLVKFIIVVASMVTFSCLIVSLLPLNVSTDLNRFHPMTMKKFSHFNGRSSMNSLDASLYFSREKMSNERSGTSRTVMDDPRQDKGTSTNTDQQAGGHQRGPTSTGTGSIFHSPSKTEQPINGCNVPNYQPHDPNTRQFSEAFLPPKCNGEPWITSVAGGTLFLNTSLLFSRVERASGCTYEEMVLHDDHDVSFSAPISFRQSALPQADFVRVQCLITHAQSRQQRRYEAYHHLMREKIEVEQQQWLRMKSRKFRRLPLSRISPKDWAALPDFVNVVMLGIDSTSRHNMIRLMPQTRSFLLDQLKAVEMTNYNKVSDNTFPNMFSLHTGTTLADIDFDHTARHYKRELNITRWDDLHYRFLWKEFAEQGYRTLYSEDSYKINTFHVENLSFRHQPAHYYARPWHIATEQYMDQAATKDRCFGRTFADEVMLTYPLDFIRLFRDKPQFSYTYLVSSTHNSLGGAGMIDGAVEKFLSTLMEENLLSNTLLVVFSDHGVRYGPFRTTPTGRFEEMRPFMFLVFPDWFQQRFPHLMKRVQKNAARFVTPLDIHATLMNILFLKHEDPLEGQRTFKKHGISLFGEIPESRTCHQAGVAAHFCVCLRDRPLSTSSALALSAAKDLVTTLNAALDDFAHLCYYMTLNKVTSFVQLDGGEMYIQDTCMEELEDEDLYMLTPFSEKGLYRIIVSVSPSSALIEATLARCGPQRFRLVGRQADFSRLNAYGNTSACAADSEVATKLCYCKS